MGSLAQLIRIKTAYTRSINLARDGESLELIRAYLPTSRTLEALTQIAEGLDDKPHQRALALIGPYGSGKSAFGLYLGALLSPHREESRQIAASTLHNADVKLARRFTEFLDNHENGFLRVQVNGIPDSLVRQLMSALAVSVEKNQLTDPALVADIRAAARPGTTMDRLLPLFRRVQSAWANVGGCGVLVEIDELGKFLEYESYHPEHREIHLLQILAEHAQELNRAPLHLVVMLHQAFEHYSHRLGKRLRDEWHKVQGRFTTLAFLEPAEQSLALVASSFEQEGKLSPEVESSLTDWSSRLAGEMALPLGLDEAKSLSLFRRCYPLHPLTLFIFPSPGQVEQIAHGLVLRGLVPPQVAEDALHIAIAAAHGVDFILTWNFKHIANPTMQYRIAGFLDEITGPALYLHT